MRAGRKGRRPRSSARLGRRAGRRAWRRAARRSAVARGTGREGASIRLLWVWLAAIGERADEGAREGRRARDRRTQQLTRAHTNPSAVQESKGRPRTLVRRYWRRWRGEERASQARASGSLVLRGAGTVTLTVRAAGCRGLRKVSGERWRRCASWRRRRLASGAMLGRGGGGRARRRAARLGAAACGHGAGPG